MAEQVDAADLKSVGSNPVPVRFWLGAPFIEMHLSKCFFCMYSNPFRQSETSLGIVRRKTQKHPIVRASKKSLAFYSGTF